MEEYCHLEPMERPLWFRFKREGDARAREELIRHNLKLVYTTYRKLAPVLPSLPPTEAEEARHVGIYALCVAVDGFDIEKGWRLSTYAAQVIAGHVRNHVLRVYCKQRDLVIPLGLMEAEEAGLLPETNGDGSEELLRAAAFQDLLAQCERRLPEKEREWLQLHYLEGKSLRRLIHDLHISYKTAQRRDLRMRTILTGIARDVGFL